MGNGMDKLKIIEYPIGSIWDEHQMNSVRHRREVQMLFRPDDEVKVCESCGEFIVGDFCDVRKGMMYGGDGGGPRDCWRIKGTVLIWDEVEESNELS